VARVTASTTPSRVVVQQQPQWWYRQRYLGRSFGLDRLTGGAGADHFVFNTLNQGIDITDFSVSVVETIEVSAAGFGVG